MGNYTTYAYKVPNKCRRLSTCHVACCEQHLSPVWCCHGAEGHPAAALCPGTLLGIPCVATPPEYTNMTVVRVKHGDALVDPMVLLLVNDYMNE